MLAKPFVGANACRARGEYMLNFDEEIKKFEKSLEPDQIDDALAQMDITDMDDIMLNMFRQATNTKPN